MRPQPIILALALVFTAAVQITPAAEPTLDFGIPMSSFTRDNPSDAAIAAEVFLKRALEGSGINYSADVYAEDMDLADAIKAGHSDVFILNSGLYLDCDSFLKLRPLLVATHTEAPVETLVLVAAKKRPLSDLKGGSLLIDNSARGETPERWISSRLLRSGSDEIGREYFSTVENVNAASRALIPVYFGKTDAAILSEADFQKMCDHNPAVDGRLEVVCRSKALTRTVVCIRSDYADYPAHRIVEILQNIHKSEDGRRFLERIGISRFLPFKEEHLLFNREVQNRLKSALTKKGDDE